MKKIYLILMLVMSTYGYSYNYQIGQTSCAEFLDEMDRGSVKGQWLLMYAMGWYDANNLLSEGGVLGLGFEKQYAPDLPVLKRSLIKHCDDNLSQKFYMAIGNMWIDEVKK